MTKTTRHTHRVIGNGSISLPPAPGQPLEELKPGTEFTPHEEFARGIERMIRKGHVELIPKKDG